MSSRKRTRARRTFDKYALYSEAVQSAEGDVVFFRKTYRELRKREPRILREDFCGTFELSCEWVKLNPRYRAVGVDLDPEPLAYGKKNGLSRLRSEQQTRVELFQDNVLSPGLPKADITVAMNFSYFIFKTRPQMKRYFTRACAGLKSQGIFLIDLFGGSLCHEENEEATKFKNFTYYWDQKSFDPITNGAVFQIHFKPKGMKKQENVFSYDWRMWTIPELRELLAECGFKKTHVYWEGTTPKGEGDGKFKRTEIGEACQSWIAYIAAEK